MSDKRRDFASSVPANGYISDSETASASNSCIRRFVITEKAPTRAFSWLKAATTAFTFKTLLLLRHFAKRVPKHVKLGCRCKDHNRTDRDRWWWFG